MRRSLIGFLVTAALAVTLAPAVRAFPAVALSSQELSTRALTGSYCAQELIPNDKAARTIAQCFATQGEALATATGNTNYLSMSDDKVREEFAATIAANGRLSADSQYLLGADYWDTHYGGNYYYWYATQGCSSTYAFYVPTMPPGWNDKVSSALSSSGCNHFYHYIDSNYNNGLYGAGKYIDCGYGAGDCYTMYLPDGSSMSDRTSSEILKA